MSGPVHFYHMGESYVIYKHSHGQSYDWLTKDPCLGTEARAPDGNKVFKKDYTQTQQAPGPYAQMATRCSEGTKQILGTNTSIC